MTIVFPSPEFDDAVAAVCHGTVSAEQAEALRDVLLRDLPARDEYIRRVQLHAYLASEPELFAGHAAAVAAEADSAVAPGSGPIVVPTSPTGPRRGEVAGGRWAFGCWRPWALAAGFVMLLTAIAWFGSGRGIPRGQTSRAVAMLNRVVNARWNGSEPFPRLGAPLDAGTLRLDSGLAQIVFYNGARVVIEGPTVLRLVSNSEAVCTQGTLTAEVPAQARGFRIVAPRLDVTDLGTAFGLKVTGDRSELHVFEGHVEFRSGSRAASRDVPQGRGAVIEGTAPPRWIPANPADFAELFDLQAKSVAADAHRYDQWRESIRKLRSDPSLWIHLDFEHGGTPAWRLPNAGSRRKTVPDATIVGCEWRDGRWATKPALEFRGISDRVRLSVPGDLDSVTLAAWVRVQGLDRQINSLFMSDGFLPGTLHWVIRNDGALGLTVVGEMRSHQILASPPVMTIDQFGLWIHLAVVLDGPARQVAHYVNGRRVSHHALRMAPPFRIGTAELGNWNPHGFSGNDPFLIRNFSGAIDEFCLFGRALTSAEVSALHAEGRPQSESSVALGLQSRIVQVVCHSTTPVPTHIIP
ncbi:MAG: LamG-like jellyroll fold domain-containing protein [Limisphaerales bacterium]